MNTAKFNYLIFGRSLNVWKAGGEDTDHSSVDPPWPHGLLTVFLFLTNASKMTIKNIIAPMPPTNAPIEAT